MSENRVSATKDESPVSSPLRRLLLFAPNWLGDAVMSLPAIDDVRRARPDLTLDVAARPSIAPLFTMVPGVNEIMILRRSAAAIREMSSRQYDAALLFPNSFNVALLARRAGIRQRWGYRRDFRTPLLTRAIALPGSVHQAAYYQHLVGSLGFPNGPLEPRLEVPPDVRQRGTEGLMAEGWDGRSPLIALAPGAAYGGAKRWPAASFAEVARGLAADGVGTVIVGAPSDGPAARELVTSMGPGLRPINLAGRTDLPLLGSVLVRCRALVTNDSGAMHFAAALGVSVIALFGPTDEHATRPLGHGRHDVLTHDVWCRPCMLRECPLTHGCMRGITVGAVMTAARSTL